MNALKPLAATTLLTLASLVGVAHAQTAYGNPWDFFAEQAQDQAAEPDAAEADLEFLTFLADSGDVEGQLLLGRSYLQGIYSPVDTKQARHWLEKAYNAGSPQAASFLSVIYLEGAGVQKDMKKAAKYAEVAANNGIALAQLNLGLMYQRGVGKEINEKKAVAWWRKAAIQRDPDAMHYLALAHSTGAGTAVDPVKALAWAKTAVLVSVNGNGSTVEELAVKLSQADQEKAYALAKMCASSDMKNCP